MRTLRLLKTVLPSLALGLLTSAAPAADVTPDPVLVKVEQGLRPLLEKSLPNSQIRVEGKQLIAEYQVRSYMVHPDGGSDDYADKPVERRGPGKGGLLLRVEIQPDHGPEGDARADARAYARPEYLSPYWQTDFDRYSLRDRKEALSLTLLTGGHFSRTLAEAVLQRITSTAPPAPLAPPDPTLKAIAERLERVVRAKRPEARVRAWGSGLSVEYHTRSLLVYGRWLTGELQGQPRLEVGPDGDGFALTVQIVPGRYEGMAVLPFEYHEPYWTTYREAPSVPGKNQYLYIATSTATRTDRELVRALRESVGP